MTNPRPGGLVRGLLLKPYISSLRILSNPRWKKLFLMVFTGFLTLYLPASGMLRLVSSSSISASVFPSLIAPSLPAVAVSLGKMVLVLDTPLILLGAIVSSYFALNITLIMYLSSDECDCNVGSNDIDKTGPVGGRLTLLRTIASTAIPLLAASSCCIGVLPVALSIMGLSLGSLAFTLILAKYWIPLAVASLILLHYNTYTLSKRISSRGGLRLGKLPS